MKNPGRKRDTVYRSNRHPPTVADFLREAESKKIKIEPEQHIAPNNNVMIEYGSPYGDTHNSHHHHQQQQQQPIYNNSHNNNNGSLIVLNCEQGMHAGTDGSALS